MSELNETVLVTGGAGYIGSHTCVELLQSGRKVIVLDNLSNASKASIEAVEQITQKKLPIIEGDIRDRVALDQVFSKNSISSVLHFAGLKAVGESNEFPLKYYDNNVNGTLNLIESMTAHDCKTLVFSSSATVYGIPEKMPLTEDSDVGAINPYGRTKLLVEEMLKDLYAADPEWRVSLLRYFNPVGAHASGEIGEDPNDIPNNLLPFISQVAVGRLDKLQVFGDDYDTADGTGVRDYIHVVDLARGHLAALDYLEPAPKLGIHNLGTGQGYSVLEAVNAFEQASGRSIPYEVSARRPGDAATSYADPTKAREELNWQAKYDLQKMCEDAWRWQSKHPMGYGS
ncbi:MAG: UDP-glucose 4-epimerase GalE [Pseudomonadales bacterium]|nr:UDP-glucose 4-epimerase GalE [Pseudomonadales bacterium]